MDTGCPSFIPEPEHNERHRVEPRKKPAQNEEGDLREVRGFPFVKPTHTTATQFYWKTISPPSVI